jgi:hypothetical protein
MAKMTVLDVRGTNGSGKSWIMRQLLTGFGHSVIKDNGVHIGYSLASLHCAIIGRYTETGGGCDGFKGGVVEVERIVRQLHPQYTHLLLEGIMVSHLYERFHNLALDLGDYQFLFLNTPIETCIERVRARRRAKGNHKPFDPQKNLVKDYDRTWNRVRNRMISAKHKVVVLNWKDPMPQVLESLTNALG